MSGFDLFRERTQCTCGFRHVDAINVSLLREPKRHRRVMYVVCRSNHLISSVRSGM